MCSITPRRIADMGSSSSPGASSACAATGSAAGGGAAGAGGRGCRSSSGCRGDGRGLRLGSCRRRRRRRCRCGLGDRDWLRRRRRCYLDRRSGSRRGRWRGCRARLDEGQDVLLRHAAAGPRSGNRGRVDAVLGGDSRDDGRDEGPAVLRGRRRHGRCRRCGCCDCCNGRGGLGCRGRSCRDHRLGLRSGSSRRSGRCGCRLGCGLSRRRRDLGAGRSDRREHGADLDGLALLHEDLRHDSLGRARHLGVDLVGRDLEQRLVAADRIADLAKPLRDRPFRNGDAHLGHHDLGLRSCRHRSSSCQYAASSRRALTTSSTCGMKAFSSGGRERHRRVGRREPHDRRVEVLERLLGDRRRDLRAEAARARVLVQDENLRAAPHALEHALLVPRDQRAEVEHLDLEPLLRELRGRLGRGVHHRAPGDDRRVVALAGARCA